MPKFKSHHRFGMRDGANGDNALPGSESLDPAALMTAPPPTDKPIAQLERVSPVASGATTDATSSANVPTVGRAMRELLPWLRVSKPASYIPLDMVLKIGERT